ncbi:MAG: S16 family serine protease [Gaiellaceae bacterium]|jgi:Lon-like protease
MGRWFSPLRLAAAGAILLVAVFAYMVTRKSDKLLEVPDPAHPLAGLISVPGSSGRQNGGGIYYVDVVLRKASLLQAAFKSFRPEGADLIAEKDFVPTGLTYSQQLKIDDETMKVSQRKASVVALRTLGLKFPAREGGVRVAAIDSDSHARGVLRTDDIVVAADGRKVATALDLFKALSRHRPGDVVQVVVRRGGKLLSFRIRTVADTLTPRRALIGFAPIEVISARLPFPVHFGLRNVGGPSAGLAFALELLEQRGRDVDRGLKIAATGEIQLDGSVTSIGGVKQKTIGARQAHVDAFLVPVDGDNAKVAKRYAHGLRIIPVKNFQQALQALATLPAKS